mgnify:CR=1 FL=1
MTRIPLAIVGCGGMGGRHLLGLKELYDSGMANVELVAACDLRRDNAEHFADEAERLLGARPAVFADLAAMAREVPDLQAVDITADARAHHSIAAAAFDLGLHVLCEKPMALTVRGANRMLEAQRRAGKVLSVAENYRRDPMSRLTRALFTRPATETTRANVYGAGPRNRTTLALALASVSAPSRSQLDVRVRPAFRASEAAPPTISAAGAAKSIDPRLERVTANA